MLGNNVEEKEVLGENVLVIYSSVNVRGKHDATGAFIPEAKAFAKFHSVPKSNMLAVPCTTLKAAKRRELIFDFIEKCPCNSIDMIAWFGHGWSQGIQFGFNKKNVSDLMDYLVSYTQDTLKHVLYACSTASTSKTTRNIGAPGTDGGFADTLRDTMYDYGFRDGWVDAHLQPGHTTKNPYILRFLCNGERYIAGGGNYLCGPRGPWWDTWSHAIRKTNFRYIFPFKANFKLSELPVM